MIFVTVGTQLPFERLVAAVDAWTGSRDTRPKVLAQVGAGYTGYGNLQCVHSLNGEAYEQAIASASLLIAHAGMGTILTALDRGVPIIVVPRDEKRGEHRDDHQKQTARQLEKMGLVTVAWDVADLPVLIERALVATASCRPAPRHRAMDLVDFIRSYLKDAIPR